MFHSRITWPCYFELVVGQYIVIEAPSKEAGLLHGGQKAKKGRRKGWGYNITFKVMPSNNLTSSHQTPPPKCSSTSL
jgi:hypothetical protein